MKEFPGRGLRVKEIGLSILLQAPFLAQAAISDVAGLIAKLCQAFAWIFTAAIILGAMFVVIAAIKYITAGGSEDKVKDAHKTALYAAIGLGAAIVARGVPAIIGSFLDATGNTTPC